MLALKHSVSSHKISENTRPKTQRTIPYIIRKYSPQDTVYHPILYQKTLAPRHSVPSHTISENTRSKTQCTIPYNIRKYSLQDTVYHPILYQKILAPRHSVPSHTISIFNVIPVRTKHLLLDLVHLEYTKGLMTTTSFCPGKFCLHFWC